MRVIFMGTPEFAVPALEALAANFEVVAVVSQPDKPKGRGKKVCAPAVKEKALALGLPCLQPLRVRDEAFIEQLRQLKPDIILVAAYARLIPQALLDLPRLGCINLHPSLLPRHRGAIPVPAAIMHGDTRTGVSTFVMEAGYDTGPILMQVETPLGPDETGSQLLERLAVLGAQVLVDTAKGLEAGTLKPQPQQGDANYTKPLKKEDLMLDWSRSAECISNYVRALAELPTAATLWQGESLKIKECHQWTPEPGMTLPNSAQPGEIVFLAKGQGPVVATGSGYALLRWVKPAGKGWMEGWPFVIGRRLQLGDRLGV